MEVSNLYRLRAVATCPLDEAVREATLEPIFQEELTRQLAAALDAHVTIYGTHSGVEVESEADAD